MCYWWGAKGCLKQGSWVVVKSWLGHVACSRCLKLYCTRSLVSWMRFHALDVTIVGGERLACHGWKRQAASHTWCRRSKLWVEMCSVRENVERVFDMVRSFVGDKAFVSIERTKGNFQYFDKPRGSTLCVFPKEGSPECWACDPGTQC
jgi:hypothetical protein